MPKWQADQQLGLQKSSARKTSRKPPGPGVMKAGKPDEQALRDLILEYVRRQHAKDREGALELRSGQAISVSPCARDPLGYGEYLQKYNSWSGRSEIRMLRPRAMHDLAVSGDPSFVRLTFRTGSTVKGSGETSAMFSRHFFILQRQSDDTWKITHDTWTNVPYDDGELR